jgi:hypothetical protein
MGQFGVIKSAKDGCIKVSLPERKGCIIWTSYLCRSVGTVWEVVDTDISLGINIWVRRYTMVASTAQPLNSMTAVLCIPWWGLNKLKLSLRLTNLFHRAKMWNHVARPCNVVCIGGLLHCIYFQLYEEPHSGVHKPWFTTNWKNFDTPLHGRTIE